MNPIINPEQIKPLVQQHLGAPVADIREIKAGGNNRLFRYHLNDGRSALIKYYQPDDRNRQHREFSAIQFLGQQGFTNVPLAIANYPADGFAIYSFIEGHTKTAAELTPSDIRQIIDFLLATQAFARDQTTTQLPDAVLACFSWQDYLTNITHRFDQFRQAAAAGHLSPEVVRFVNQYSLVQEFDSRLAEALRGLSPSDISRPLPPAAHRLNPLDLGPHNMIFRPDEPPCFIDLEYFGWDDPLRTVADLMTHDQMRPAPAGTAQLIQDYFLAHCALPAEVTDRLPRTVRLLQIEWLAIFLFAFTPAKIKARQFADPHFDRAAYESKQLAKVKAALEVN